MRKAALFALASCMILSYACTDEGIPVSQQNQNEETLAVDDNDVTGDEVAAIANTLFPGKATSRSGGLSIAEFSEARTTTIYVVNYPEDGGFLLLSGKKSHSPVLAYSDTGHFCIDDSAPRQRMAQKHICRRIRQSESYSRLSPAHSPGVVPAGHFHND